VASLKESTPRGKASAAQSLLEYLRARDEKAEKAAAAEKAEKARKPCNFKIDLILRRLKTTAEDMPVDAVCDLCKQPVHQHNA
jgi:hypothetical protein